jgi:hypothetical protein
MYIVVYINKKRWAIILMCTKVNFISFKDNHSLHKDKNMSPAINLPIPAIKALKKVGKASALRAGSGELPWN